MSNRRVKMSETDEERRERLSKVRNAPDPMPLADAKRTTEKTEDFDGESDT